MNSSYPIFKNIRLYKLAGALPPNRELAEKLAEHPLMSCAGMSLESWGIVRADYLPSMANYLLITVGSEHKTIPASAVRKLADEKAVALEDFQGYKPGKHQRRALKEAAITELLPRAIAKERHTRIWIQRETGIIYVDASTASRAESCLEYLRRTLDSFPVAMLETENSAQSFMTMGLANNCDFGGFFDVGSQAHLSSSGAEAATVRYTNHALGDSEIAAHIKSGKTVKRVGLIYGEIIAFVLAEPLCIMGVKRLDIDRQPEREYENEADEFEADVALATSAMHGLVSALISVLGGEKK